MTRTLVALWLVSSTCTGSEHVAKGDTSAMTPEPVAHTGLGIRFAPNDIDVGTRIGELVVDSMEVNRAVDSSWVGTARFSGELTLSGRFMRHFDSDVDAICFEADSTSASRMPRWAGDTRRPWLCFADATEARRQLPTTWDVPATVVIDRFTIHRGLSDQVNSARLVRVTSVERT